MKIQKAVITAAGQDQRKLPLQTLIDRDGKEKSVLEILIEEIRSAGIEEIAIVINAADEQNYRKIGGPYAGQLHFIHQDKPQGYGYAVFCAKKFTGEAPFLHLVGDHLYVNRNTDRCAARLVDFAAKESCSVSAVQATRENLIPHYGVIGGSRVRGKNDVYKIEHVIEKPAPTVAEQKLTVPGLRAGYYLCFFGMHVLTGKVMRILEEKLTGNPPFNLNLSEALDELSLKEKFLALEMTDLRFDVGARYGLMKAQLALALCGQDRDRILSELLEFFTIREMDSVGR